MSKLVCSVCRSETEMPRHCGSLMKAKVATGGGIEFLYCDACGYEADPPRHHDKVMTLAQ